MYDEKERDKKLRQHHRKENRTKSLARVLFCRLFRHRSANPSEGAASVDNRAGLRKADLSPKVRCHTDFL
ncbi:hypothetical protein J5J10_04535 [Ciceribacter sp. L1K23]|uniref:hypothetical protein n=1 Tax=Ciceribacter sp. L1K23 TaxID=2820276 RepID=UPI001B819989|nr:hypothetical protein [Ciceribacter sp. L1K23]MBR0554941.1 hypothetical protein [Ciceribacter sp. L1K23]